MTGPRACKVSLYHHLPFMIYACMVECILEVFPKSKTGLNLWVQSRFSLGSMDRCPDSVVTSRDQSGVGSRFNEALVNAISKEPQGPSAQESVACSFSSHIESRLQTDSDWNGPSLKVLHDVAVSY